MCIRDRNPTEPILQENMLSHVQILHRGGAHLTELDLESYQYFSDGALSQELDLLNLEPALYEFTMDPLDILNGLENHLRVNHTASERTTTPEDAEKMKRCLGWIGEERFQQTLNHTTLLAKNHMRIPMRRHFKSREPVLNRNRLAETYATDTFFAETTAIDGSTCAQLFTGCKSYFTKVFGMKKESKACLLYTSPSPRDLSTSRMPSSA